MGSIHFFVPCESVNHCILDRSFLATLDTVASLVILNLKYHDDSDRSVIIKVNLLGVRRIHEAILENSIVVAFISEKEVGDESRKRA